MNKLASNGPQEVAFMIPDISGFTKFLSGTEIRHSKHIIEELIEVIGRETKDYFELAEVEGDALFLYQRTDAIDGDTIFKVARNTFIAFHQHLLNYENLRICTCGACSSAINLSLKFIMHVGTMELATVQGKQKPYGLDVIKAHRLMKNNVKGNEYLLISNDYNQRFGTGAIELDLIAGSATYDEIGEMPYQYGALTHLKNDLQPDERQMSSPGKSLKTLVSAEAEINAPLNVVYEVLSDFQYRPVWNSEAKIVDHNEDDIYQVGTEHYCIINNKKHQIRTVGNPDSKLEFGEQALNTGPFRELNLYFVFNKSDEASEHTRLTIEIRANVITLLRPFVNLFVKPKLRKKIPEVLESIKKLSERLAVERKEEINTPVVLD